MRLWSIHPEYLDTKGLLALWREGLLAQKVLSGNTVGYRNHPQLIRFKESANPLGTIAEYLRCIEEEAKKRGYNFDAAKIANRSTKIVLAVNSGQIAYEMDHLLQKLKTRDPSRYESIKNIKSAKLHPLFKRKAGGVESWEKWK